MEAILNLYGLKDFTFSRVLKLDGFLRKLGLIISSDGSVKAYSANVYVGRENESGDYVTKQIVVKNRIDHLRQYLSSNYYYAVLP